MKKYSSKTKKIFTAIVACFSVFLIVGIAYAAYVYSEGVRTNSTVSMKDKTELVDIGGVGWNIRNTTGLDYFVPNKTQAEFDLFKTAAGLISNLDVCEYHKYSRCVNDGEMIHGELIEDSAVYWFDDCNYMDDKIVDCCNPYGGCLGNHIGSKCNRCAFVCLPSDETSGACEEGGPLCAGPGCIVNQFICEGKGMVFAKVALYGGSCVGWSWTCTCP